MAITLDGTASTVKADVYRGHTGTGSQMGGDLDLNSNDITGTGGIPAANLTGTLPAIDGSSLTGISAQKNIIINGDFNIWQRGTSFAAPANSTYHADRFVYFKGGSMVHTISRDTDIPTVAESGHLSNYSVKADCTTASGGIGAADYCMIAYRVEGHDFRYLAQKAMTLSFWHKHTKTGTHCVGLSNSGNDRSYVTEYTQTTTDTWEKATVVIPASPSAGTWNYTTSIGVQIQFVMAAGTNYQMTPDAWTAANNFGTSSQVDATDSTSNNFRIAQVQLEAGSVATDFEIRNHATELAMCQRYYEHCACSVRVMAHAANNYNNSAINFAVQKRITPTIAQYTAGSSVNGTCGSANSTPQGFRFELTTLASGDSYCIGYMYSASAEL